MTDRLFCQIRKRWLAATPEEKVRQSFIKHLIDHLGYPQGHIILEKGLEQIRAFNSNYPLSFPNRRIDLLVVAKDLHPQFNLYPLLLVECKAIPIQPKALRQVMGYNHFLGACFVAVANQTEAQLGWIDPPTKTLCVAPGIPPYETLYQRALIYFLNKNLIN